MRTYRADLHIHSCLSPCGRPSMTPKAIVAAALDRGVDLIAVTDHNTARMTPIMAEVARGHGLAYLYGIEVQTREDVHLLAYFDDEETCLGFSEEIYEQLADTRDDPYGLGEQTEVDADGTIVRIEPKFLVQGIALTFVEAAHRIEALGGLAVPAHIDRDFFSVTSQLGRLPDGLAFSVIEVRGRAIPDMCGAAAILRTSDAHDLPQIGERITRISVDAVTVAELCNAAAGVDGRSMTAECVGR